MTDVAAMAKRILRMPNLPYFFTEVPSARPRFIILGDGGVGETPITYRLISNTEWLCSIGVTTDPLTDAMIEHSIDAMKELIELKCLRKPVLANVSAQTVFLASLYESQRRQIELQINTYEYFGRLLIERERPRQRLFY